MFDIFLTALTQLLSPEHILYLIVGIVLGLIVGILPGLGGMAGLSLVLPLIYGMDASSALAMMVGLISITQTSDTFTSILMGIPGTAASQATVIDGFQMSQRGEGARALAAGFTASMSGGVFGALILTFAVFYAEPLILSIGFGEQMMLVLFAMTMVGVLTAESPMKGLASAFIGMMIGAIGAAPSTGIVRLGFGTEYLIEPISIVIMGLGLFAIPEIVDLMRNRQAISKTGKLSSAGALQGIRDVGNNLWLALRCGGIGAFIGALPGLGGAVVDWIAYGHAVQTCKNGETIGRGDVRGVIAPESANNAKEGGALLPTILFGIPGSGTMAVLLAGFYLVGINPGIQMVTENLDLTFVMIWSLALANIIGAGTCLIFSRYIAKLTTVRYALIAPLIIGVIFFAAFQTTRSWSDFIALAVLGLLGVYFKRFGWSRPAILIGFVLSNGIESSIYLTSVVYGFEVFLRPLAMIILTVTVVSAFFSVRKRVSVADLGALAHDPKHKLPQLVFLGVLFILPVALLADVMQHDRTTYLFPMIAAIGALVLMVLHGLVLLSAKNPMVEIYDAEADKSDSLLGRDRIERYLLWIAGMLLVSAVVGWATGITIFIFAYLVHEAGLSRRVSALIAALFLGFTAILAYLLVLRYPAGLLSYAIPLLEFW